MHLELPAERQRFVEARFQDLDAELDDLLRRTVQSCEHHDVHELAHDAIVNWLQRRQDLVATEWMHLAETEDQFRCAVELNDDRTLDSTARQMFLHCCQLLTTFSVTPVEYPECVRNGFRQLLWSSLDIWLDCYRKLRAAGNEAQPLIHKSGAVVNRRMAADPSGQLVKTANHAKLGEAAIQGIARGRATAETDEVPSDSESRKTKDPLGYHWDLLTPEGRLRARRERTNARADLLKALVAYWDASPGSASERLGVGHPIDFVPAFTHYAEQIFEAFASEFSRWPAEGAITAGEFKDQLVSLSSSVVDHVFPRISLTSPQARSWCVTAVVRAFKCSEATKSGAGPEVRRLRLKRFNERFWSYLHEDSIRLDFWDAIRERLVMRIDTHWIPLAVGLESGVIHQSSDCGKAPGECERLPATVNSPIAARKMERHLKAKGIGLTEFAVAVGVTDRTLRTFRKTGKVRRDIFDAIAVAMETTRESLLRAE